MSVKLAENSNKNILNESKQITEYFIYMIILIIQSDFGAIKKLLNFKYYIFVIRILLNINLIKK